MSVIRKKRITRQSGGRTQRIYRRFLALPTVLRRGLALILCLTMLYGLLLLNQAQITRMALDNAALEAEMRYLRRQIAQTREQYLKSSDLAQLRSAAEALGMVFPLEGQIVRVDVSRQNYVSFDEGREAANGEQAEYELQRAMQAVGEHLRGEAGEGRTEVFKESKELAQSSSQNSDSNSTQGQEADHE